LSLALELSGSKFFVMAMDGHPISMS